MVRGAHYRWRVRAVVAAVDCRVGLGWLVPCQSTMNLSKSSPASPGICPAPCSTRTAPPIDLTGATLEWVLVDSGGNPAAIAAEVTVTNAARGEICLSISGDDTAGLDPGLYNDGLRVTKPGGERQTWHGYIQVDANRFAG